LYWRSGWDPWSVRFELGVNYQLYAIGTGPGGTDTAVGLPLVGTGFPLNFGLIAGEGDYYVTGSSIDCTQPMIGQFNLRFNPLPIAYQMTGSGIYCGDVVGAAIELTGSEVDVNYKLLWYNGSFNQLMSSIDGSGLPLTFSGQFNQGDYTVYARNNITGCTSSMNGSVKVVQLPAPDTTGIVLVIDSTSYCSSAGGVEIGLSAAEDGVTYSIIDEATNIIAASVTPMVTDPLIIGTVVAGVYRIEASRSGECVVEIASGITITENPSPIVYELTGPASGCASSIELNLLGSELGVLYQLYSDALMIPGNEDGYVAGYDATGTGDTLTIQVVGFASGTSFFWIKATYPGGCSSNTEWIEVTVKQAANPFTVELPNGNEYCADEPGVLIRLSATDIGVGYQLILDGKTVDFIDGDGNAQDYGLPHSEGTYFVRARHFDSGCFFETDTFTVIMHPMPAIFDMSPGGSVNVQEITVDGSEVNVTYYLFVDDLVVPTDTLSGDGAPLNFGTVTLSGVYKVLGVGVGGCASWMNGESVIFETPLVAINDTLYLRKKDLNGVISIGLNDLLLPGVDILGDNIKFELSVNPPNNKPYGTVSLDANTGALIYEKLPSFYGKDSVTYIISNTEIPSRVSTAKVYIMVGNKDFGDDMSFVLPNAFSPNGDGLNEFFVISGLGETEESNLEVFNRWGTIVFRSSGVRYEDDWDGRSNIGAMVSIGTELPNGTYYYIFKVKKNVEGKVISTTYNGFVELRR
jgi:gliding motility-associated-like protein